MLCLAIMYISQILEQGQTMSDFAFWKKTNNEILVYRFCFEISHNSDFFILNIENIVLFEKILSFGDIAKVFIRLWILDVLKQSWFSCSNCFTIFMSVPEVDLGGKGGPFYVSLYHG